MSLNSSILFVAGILAFVIVVSQCASSEEGAEGPALAPLSTKWGKVAFLNFTPSSPDEKRCLLSAVETLLTLLDEGALVPFRVKLSRSHTLVKETWSSRSIHITRSDDKNPQQILFRLEERGRKVILFDYPGQRDAYGLYGIPESSPPLNLCISKE